VKAKNLVETFVSRPGSFDVGNQSAPAQ
jgi:hypothetical protein